MIPTFFIVGAPRCGTSSLHQYLEAHPRVFMSRPKEPHHFGSDLEVRPRHFADREAYLSLFKGAGDAQHAGEASVLYLYSRAAPREILALNPDARIIIMLRDPVDFIPSLHAHNLLLTYEDIPDLGQALEAEADRREGRRIPANCVAPVALQYTALAKYAEHVERYLEAFGRERVLCILFEDLRTAPEAVYDRTLAFLGLEAGPRPKFTTHNPRQMWRHQGLARVAISALRRILLWSERLPKPLQRSLFVILGIVFYLPARLNLQPARGTPLPPELRRALRERLRDDVARLGGILGRDLSAWSNPDA